MKTRFLTVAAVCAGTLISSAAAAQNQPWLRDRRVGEGIGIRTGNLELHPGVSGEVGYDSNYFQRSGDGNEPEIAAWRFRVTPSLSLKTVRGRRRAVLGGATQEKPKVAFAADVSAAYNELVAADSQFSDDVSKQRHLGAKAGFKLDVFPQGRWGADLYADYLRTVEPSNDPDTNVAFDRDTARFGAGVNWRPGGGLFHWRLGYEGRVTFFEDTAFEEFNNVQHYAKTRGRWRFLPRTALLYDAELGFIGYSNNTAQKDSTPVRARIGLNGLVTNHFAMLALVGWGASFYESRRGEPVQDFDSVIGQAELKWYPQPRPELESTSAPVGLSSIALGYVRSFRNSYLGDYYQRDRVYGKLAYFIAGQVVLSLDGGYSRIYHPVPFFNTTPPQPRQANGNVGAFSENRVDAVAFIEYRLSDTFGLNLTGRYDASLDDNRVQTNPADPTATDNLKFGRYRVFVGARWFM